MNQKNNVNLKQLFSLVGYGAPRGHLTVFGDICGGWGGGKGRGEVLLESSE